MFPAAAIPNQHNRALSTNGGHGAHAAFSSASSPFSLCVLCVQAVLRRGKQTDQRRQWQFARPASVNVRAATGTNSHS